MNPPKPKVRIGLWMLAGEGFDFQDLRESKTVIQRCVDNGLTAFDTAPIYGRGNADRLLASFSNHALDISSKTGLSFEGRQYAHNGTPAFIRQDVMATCNRLKIPMIPTMYLHWPDPNTPVKTSIDALVSLKKDGIIQQVGLSNPRRSDIEPVAESLDIIQLNHSLFHNQLDALIHIKRQYPWIKTSVYGIFEQGLLLDPFKNLSSRDRRRRHAMLQPNHTSFREHWAQTSPKDRLLAIKTWGGAMAPYVDEFVVGVRSVPQLDAVRTLFNNG